MVLGDVVSQVLLVRCGLMFSKSPKLTSEMSQREVLRRILSLYVLNFYQNIKLRTLFPEGVGRGVLPSKRLLRMCRWIGSHFHNWVGYNGVTFLVELLEWGCTFSGFLG